MDGNRAYHRAGSRVYLWFCIFFAFSAALQAQTVYRTFQGEIADKVFFLHTELTDGIITGFYKYQTDSIVVPLAGNIDHDGNIALTGSQQSFPAFSGKLQELTVNGIFRATEIAEPQTFYAVNLNEHFYIDLEKSVGVAERNRGKGIFFALLDEAFSLLHWRSRGLITTQQEADGSIYVLCEPLNAKLLLNGYSLIVDTSNGLPAIDLPRDQFSGTVVYTAHYVNTPEARHNWDFPAEETKLNDNYIVRHRPVGIDEITVRTWEWAPLRHRVVRITDVDEAQKMLGERMKITEFFFPDEPGPYRTFEITFNDGVIIKLEYEEFGEFYAYYPELDILCIWEYGCFDLNDSKIEHDMDYADNSVLSPDKQYLIIYGYRACPALKILNNTTKKYEFIGDFYEVIHYGNNWNVGFCSTKNWFWTNENKAFFSLDLSDDDNIRHHYEIEIILIEDNPE